ncbi:GMC family oxidoreductase (plasmid) [Roseibium aggregatum]|uniref:GMC family oxidoreductase n=1 Tax=Roseibium aggregatum TaxID=187304 RepID=UPI001E408858|nr:GMC family oxidoreductase [Roseibium aggregatum]UES60122.1 GMC family oxidoreductase [Roseibium aggregatum]
MTPPSHDVAIIGTGFAGSLIAQSLAEAGMNVLMLEAGLPFEDERHLRHSLRDAFAVSDEGEIFAPYSDLLAPQERGRKSEYYVQDKDGAAGGFDGHYLRLVGGTGLAWLGTALRMCPNDFRMRTEYGRGRDWPISYADLEPWYCAAEREIGVAGTEEADASLRSSRSQPFPMPPIPQSYADRYAEDRIDGLRFGSSDIRIVPTPQARNSVDGYNGRPLCEGYASCVPLCPAGAKYDPLVHLRRALLAGAELYAGTVVIHLETTEDGRVAKAWFLDPDGNAGSVAARVFVLAANGIETPKLLLQSNHRFPQGLANESGQVGRNLMDHAEKHSCALVPDPIFPYRGPQSTSGIEMLRDGAFRKDRSAFRTALRNDGWRNVNGAPSGNPQASRMLEGTLLDLVGNRNLSGLRLRRKIEEMGVRQFALQSVLEMLPDPENRISLSTAEKDALGLPRPDIRFSIDRYTRDGIEVAAGLHRKIFQRLGCASETVFVDLQPDPTGSDAGGSHIMGTTIMGTDPRASVVDPHCRAHAHGNLFIGGSSVFPTGGTSNPTLTICALALRIAHTVTERMQTI